jgi:hypothetical protein
MPTVASDRSTTATSSNHPLAPTDSLAPFAELMGSVHVYVFRHGPSRVVNRRAVSAIQAGTASWGFIICNPFIFPAASNVAYTLRAFDVARGWAPRFTSRPRGGVVAQDIGITRDSLRTPRAAAIAGIVFAVLLGTALVLLRISVPANPHDAPTWLDDQWHKNAVVLALNLVPFAGLAFLWFIGVIRDRIGAAEDRFFATVFLGTGLLFVAMLFVAAGVAGGLIAAESRRGSSAISPEVWRFGRQTTYLVLNVYAMRMAGAFTLSTTVIALRLGILPRWLAVFGSVVAVVLLVTVDRFAWVQILFPVWVLVLSIHLLVHPPPAGNAGDAAT